MLEKENCCLKAAHLLNNNNNSISNNNNNNDPVDFKLPAEPDLIRSVLKTLGYQTLEQSDMYFCAEPQTGSLPYGRGVPAWSDGRAPPNQRSLSSQSFNVPIRPFANSAISDVNPTLTVQSFSASQIPAELEEHLRTCRCTCNHMGYGNFQTLPRHNGKAGRSFSTSQQILNHEMSMQDPKIFLAASLRRNSIGPDRANCDLATYPPTNEEEAKIFQEYNETPLISTATSSLRKDSSLERTSSYKQVSIGSTTTFNDDSIPQTGFKEYSNVLLPSKGEGSSANEGTSKENLLSACGPSTIAVAYASGSSPPSANHRSRAVARYQVSEYNFDQEHPESPFSEDRECEEKKRSWVIYTWRHWCVLAALLILSGSVVLAVALPLTARSYAGSIAAQTAALDRILKNVPLIDGHNDLAWNIRNFVHNKLENVDLSQNLSAVEPWGSSPWSHTDIFRLVHGRIGAQFWAVYVPCGAQFLNAAQITLEQIDVIKRLIAKYPKILGYADSHDSLLRVYKSGRVASLLGIEGGHLMGASLSVLRMYYDLGIRYMTLTHSCNTPWADSSLADSPGHQAENFGLNDFGAKVILEMNRLGMIVDLAHVSQQTMRDALAVSRAPVIFSHSAAYTICPHSRNVPDDVIRQVHLNGGILMINFYNYFLTCNASASVHDVVVHLNHIRDIAGIDHVGIGADFDGINKTPHGLEDVSKYPNLLIELLKDPTWSEDDVAKVAGENFLRVLKGAEEVRDEMISSIPYEDHIHPDNLVGRRTCWWT